MQNDKHAKTVRRQKNMPSAIIPDKAIILHTLEDAGITFYNMWYKLDIAAKAQSMRGYSVPEAGGIVTVATMCHEELTNATRRFKHPESTLVLKPQDMDRGLTNPGCIAKATCWLRVCLKSPVLCRYLHTWPAIEDIDSRKWTINKTAIVVNYIDQLS